MSSGGSSSSDPSWESVPSDSRYEEKFIEKPDGTITRITRVADQESEYPHWTETYGAGDKNTHYSEHSREHSSAHRTGSSVLDDLGIGDK